MGKKGKNKGAHVASTQSAPKVETEKVEVEEKKIVEEPKVVKVEEKKTETKEAVKLEENPAPVLENSENNDEKNGEEDSASKSKKKRNKKKNQGVEVENNEVEKVEPEKSLVVEVKSVEVKPVEVKPVEEVKKENEKSEENASNTETMKKKRNRNKKKTNGQNEVEEKIEISEPVKEPAPKALEVQSTAENDDEAAGENTLKKRKRNKNKNKNKTAEETTPIVGEVAEEAKKDEKIAERIEPQPEAPKPEARKGKNSQASKNSKRSIPDELKEKEEREKQEAAIGLRNEITRREKLLEKIDMVLDCKKSEAKVAQDQQESLKELSELTSQSKAAHKQLEEEEFLVDKIEQILGVTKLEIKNVQHQQAFVGRLESELAKVKKTKDKYLRGEIEPSTSDSPKLPEHIEKMSREMKDVKKHKPRKTEDLIKEIESRDVLMAEINKVLDTTKNEIEKVQKQQKIIANLETELHKIKEAEISEKLIEINENMDPEELEVERKPKPAPAPVAKPISASASLLDALMANVGKLKEAQALKQQQKEEASKVQAVEAPKVEEIKKIESKVIVEKQKTVEIPSIKEKEMTTEVSTMKIEEEKEPIVKSEETKPVESKQSPQSSPKGSKKPQANNKNSSKNQKKTEVIAQKEKSPVKEIVAETVKAIESLVELVKLAEPVKVVESVKHAEQVKVSEPGPIVLKEVPKSVEAPKDLPKPKIAEVKKETAEVKKESVPEVPAKQEIVKDTKEPSTPAPELHAIVEPSKTTETEKVAQKAPASPKKNDKHKKGSPQGSPKHNKNNQQKQKSEIKPDSPKPVVSMPQETSAWGKPSMADILKNARDPEPDEIKPPEKIVEQAPIALPESTFDDNKTMVVCQNTEVVKPAVAEVKAVIVEKSPLVNVELPVIASGSTTLEFDDSMVIVEKSDVEPLKELETNNKTDSKNVEGSGFVSLVEKQDVKPLRKDDEKLPHGKTKSPVKATSPRSSVKVPTNKTPTKPVATSPKPKSVPSKAPEVKKPIAKPVISTVEKKDTPAPPKPQTEISPVSTELTKTAPAATSPEKPKIAPKPELVKNVSKPTSSSPSRTSPKPGNVNPSPTPIATPKSKTPSPVKPVTKLASTQPSPPAQTITAKPKPLVPPRPTPTKPAPTLKQPASQKTPTMKTNGTKTSTPKAAAATFNFRHQMEVNNSKFISQPAFSSLLTDGKSNDPTQTPLNSSSPQNNQMNAILTSDGTIIIKFSTDEPKSDFSFKDKFLSKEISTGNVAKDSFASSSISLKSSQTPIDLNRQPKFFESETEDEEQFSEYKQTPRHVFMSTTCHVCKVNLSRYFLCNGCKMVSYCKEDHLKVDYLNHKALCLAIQLIAKRRGGHVYNQSKHLTPTEFRNLKAHTLYLCEQFLNRSLQPFEREIFLFPRLCHEANCREWKSSSLNDCAKCGQVSHCTMHTLSDDHLSFCCSYALYQKIILRQKSYGKIEVTLPHRVLKNSPVLSENLEETLMLLYKNITAFRDECVKATLMQISTFPLTAFYAQQMIQMQSCSEKMVIHLVGAELQCEGDSLDKWEAFFIHLMPDVSDLQIVFIGPELNTENLPIEIISRTRMCRICRQNCRGIRFDFQCKKFYHDYCSSSSYVKPNLVCFFNPALHRPGFRGFDTWPKTILAALDSSAPVLVTSLTKNESLLDLERIEKVASNDVNILQMPKLNSYASTRPERNFASDDNAPIMFKNQYLFIVRRPRDLIDL